VKGRKKYCPEERDIMSCFTKLSLINDMGKISEGIERRESNK